MEELKKAINIAISITSENSTVPFELLVNKICTELHKKDLLEYYDIITKLMCETRNHLRCSHDL